jgi:hypothetical protein
MAPDHESSSNEVSPFETLADAAKQIRIATLQPGEFDDPVSCNLEVHHLEDPPSYQALSYCWGDENETFTINLEGYDWQITENLYEALSAIRLTTEPILLWIDAICINPDDIPEKNSQIQRMGDIFESATRVLAWLGKGDVDVSEPFEMIYQFSELLANIIAEEMHPNWSFSHC